MKKKTESFAEIIGKCGNIGKDRFFLIFLAGILCVIIAVPIGNLNKREATENETQKKTQQENTQQENAYEETGYSLDITQNISEEMTPTEYGEYLGEKLEKFLARIDGVGEVHVFVSMYASSELVLEHNTPYSRKAEDEVTQDTSRTTTETDNESEVVLRKLEDGSEQPIVLKILVPSIKGIVVEAQGGGKSSVQKTITEALEALFGIEEHKIKVVKLST